MPVKMVGYLDFLYSFLVAASLHAEEGQLAANAGFEDAKTSKGWIVPSMWKVVDGVGRKG